MFRLCRPLLGRFPEIFRLAPAIVAAVVAALGGAASDAADLPAVRALTAEQFLREVLAGNLDYAAQRYNVTLAQADAVAARLWPNPTLSVGATRDLTYHGRFAPGPAGEPVPQALPEPRSVGLTQTFEISGQRHWRVHAADETAAAAAATLEDFLRNLGWDAMSAYTDAQARRAALEQQRQAFGYAAELVAAQSARFHAGDLSEADFAASRVEQLQLENDLRQTEADADAARLNLAAFLGRERNDAAVEPADGFVPPSGQYDLPALLAHAADVRPDLIALRRAAEAAQSAVRAARAGRIPDVDLGVTYTESPASQNFVAPAPHDHQLSLSLSVPFPLWNRNQAEIRRQSATAAQAQRQLESAELKAAVQIRTAFRAYETARRRVAQFEDGLLRAADTVLTSRRYSYAHGQTSLLELIDAERTDNDVRQKHLDAIADAIKARIDLLRAAGMTAPFQ